MSSIAFDFTARQRLGGLNMSEFVMVETPLPRRDIRAAEIHAFISCMTRLAIGTTSFSQPLAQLAPGHLIAGDKWALTPHERLRALCVAEALSAFLFELDLDQFRWLLRDCDHPRNEANSNDFSSRLDTKGFWRVDKEKDPELRHTVLAQVAYADLTAQGLDAFLTGPDGDGWQLPETLRLSDYGLGQDDRAREPQPVASRLGPRFLDWQLAKDPAQSWAECEAHAAQLEALWRHARQLAGTADTADDSGEESSSRVAETPTIYRERELLPNPQGELF